MGHTLLSKELQMMYNSEAFKNVETISNILHKDASVFIKELGFDVQVCPNCKGLDMGKVCDTVVKGCDYCKGDCFIK